MASAAVYSLAIVSMFRNPNIADLLEWISYHQVIGVQRFILYDHGHPQGHSGNLAQVEDALKALGDPHIELRTSIHPGRWQHTPLHYGIRRDPETSFDEFQFTAAYIDALETEREQCQWLAFIDHDEFLHPEQHASLPEYLKEFENRPEIGAILVQMRRFGASGHRQRPDGLVLENYTWRERDFFPDTLDNARLRKRLAIRGNYAKTIGRSKDLTHPFFGSHSWETRAGTHWLRETAQRLQLKHYFTKSEQDYRVKQSLGGFSKVAPHQSWEHFDQLNHTGEQENPPQSALPSLALVEDRSMLRYLQPVRERLARLPLSLTEYQSPQSPLPNLLIAGAMKAGTSAAIANLGLHPDIWCVDKKVKERVNDNFTHPEVHFFDLDERWEKGMGWYARFFATAGNHRIIAEKSANYLCVLEAHKRILRTLPHVKILVFLRDPVQRAYSHWNHMRDVDPIWDNHQYGKLSFADAIEANLTAAKGDKDLLWNGYYATHLEHLYKLMPRESVYVAISERVRNDMVGEYNRIYDFLGLRRHEELHYGMHNQRKKPAQSMTAETEALLKEHFKPHNEALFDLLGESVPEWD